MGETRRIRNLETGVVWEVSAAEADYLLTGGPNALHDFVPGVELVDEDTPAGAPADVVAASTPLGEGEASPPADPTPARDRGESAPEAEAEEPSEDESEAESADDES